MGDAKAAEPQSKPAHRDGVRLPAQGGGATVYTESASEYAVGNAALFRMLRSGALRPRLAVSQPDDPDEREADRLADLFVARQAAPSAGGDHGCSCTPRHRCAECEASMRGGGLQRQVRRSHAPEPAIDGDASRVVSRLGSGHGLDAAQRTQYESFFGRDLSGIRIHTSADASTTADALHARAFAVGSNIAFAKGEWAPHTVTGQRLLAHELAHVSQHAEIVHRQPVADAPGADAKAMSSSTTTSVAEPPRISDAGDVIVVWGMAFRPTRQDARLALGVAFEKVGVHGAQILDQTLRQMLPHKFGNPMTGSVRDVPASGSATTAAGRSAIEAFLPLLVEEAGALHKEHQDFQALVRAATQLRLQANNQSLGMWRSFIDAQIAPLELQGQLAAGLVKQYSPKAFHHPDPVRAYQALHTMFATTNIAVQRTEAAVLEQRIHGGCQYCHTMVYESSNAAQLYDPNEPNHSILEQLRAGQSAPMPWFAPADTGAGAMDAWLDPSAQKDPVLAESVQLANRIQPYLRQLGPRGYKVLDLDDVGLLDLPPSKLRRYVLDRIDARMEHFRIAIQKAGEPDFDYLIPQVVVEELLPLQDPALQQYVQADMKHRAEEARKKSIGLMILGAVSLLLTIFPPTAPLGIALGIATGVLGFAESYDTYKQGVLLGHMVGASNVITEQQMRAAAQMRIMGQIGMVMNAIGVVAPIAGGGLKILRLIRTPTSAIQAVEVEAAGQRVLIEGIDTASPVATVESGPSASTKILLPGEPGGGAPRVSGGGPLGGGGTPGAKPATLYLPGRGVNAALSDLSGPQALRAMEGRLILLDELGQPIKISKTPAGTITAEMDASTLLNESRLVGASGEPLAPQVSRPFQPLFDQFGRPMAPSAPTGPVMLDLQAGTPAFGSRFAQQNPGAQVFGAEPGNWLLAYQKIHPTSVQDLEMSMQIARNSPVWPNTPAWRTSIPAMPRALPWEMDPATHLFPSQGPVVMLRQPGNPNLGAPFFPAMGGGGRLIPFNPADVVGVRPSAPLPLPMRVDSIFLRRPFGLGAADEAVSRSLGNQINEALNPGGFMEIRATRATDIGKAQVDAIAKAIPGSTTVRVSEKAVQAFKETGQFPPNATAIEQDMIRGAAADVEGLGKGEFKWVVRIYKPQ